ncbi:MAG: peptide-methionine (S)-S-oxide reductase MsrA [Bacteroidota bacterium]|nr:peptide-methionine (S)-S-oxide reductase MsrA [Bacteroidota bacterium]
MYIVTVFINLNLNSQTNYSEAYFASGCFWCVEAIYESLNGVSEVQSGYSGGKTKNPDYYQVLTGKTGHAETVKVIYDSKKISFKKLVEVFFASHDPTTLNRQGPDIGTHYRSIAFYKNEVEKNIIKNEIQRLLDNKTYKRIVTEVTKFEIFYIAEDYHQDYKINNPNNPYIWKVSVPRINDFKMKFPELIN